MKRALALALALLAGCEQAQDAPAPDASPIAHASVTPAPVASTEPPRGPLAPRDDCTGNPKAVAFVSQLRGIVAARDLDRLMALTDPQVQLGFGGVDGAANMRGAFSAADRGMWQELAEVVSMGCTVDQSGNLVMPWYFAQDIPGDFFDYMIVAGTDVAIRDQPRAGATQVTAISWDVVDLVPSLEEGGGTVFGGPPGDGWMQVRTRDDNPVTGYIREADLRSVVDYRLIADKTEGPYRISAFLAGD